jgi:hypothetical protein
MAGRPLGSGSSGRDTRQVGRQAVGAGGCAALPPGQVLHPIPIVAPAFVHVPAITLMRGGVPIAVNGPIDRVVPRITPATAPGWEKWFNDRTVHAIARDKAGKEARDAVHAFNDERL